MARIGSAGWGTGEALTKFPLNQFCLCGNLTLLFQAHCGRNWNLHHFGPFFFLSPVADVFQSIPILRCSQSPHFCETEGAALFLFSYSSNTRGRKRLKC